MWVGERERECLCVPGRRRQADRGEPASVACVLKLGRFTCRAPVLLHLNLWEVEVEMYSAQMRLRLARKPISFTSGNSN